VNRRETAHQRIEQEILKEKSEALGRAGERLELLLAELRAVDSALDAVDGSGSADTVAELERRHATLRDRALEARRYLMIQREAIGFRRHSVVTELFPVPPPRGNGRSVQRGVRNE
jgi:hypothetical protein